MKNNNNTLKEVKRSKSFKPKEVKENFYFTVYNLIKLNLNPIKIAQKLNISKQHLNWYLSSLKKDKLIEKIGYGVWKIKEVKRSKSFSEVGTEKRGFKTFTSFKKLKKEVRGHGAVFSLKLPRIKNWDKRELYLQKKGVLYKKIHQGYSFLFRNFRIWLCNKSIVFFQRSGVDFIDFNSKLAKKSILNIFLNEIRALENFLKTSFNINKQYHFKISRQHYGLIKNELAKIYDKKKKKLDIRDNKGLWLIIDNSFNLHELETVHKDTAVKDNITVQNFFNSLKENPITVNQILEIQLREAKKWGFYAETIKNHVEAIKTLGIKVNELAIVIDKLPKNPPKIKEKPSLKRNYGLSNKEMKLIRK